MSRTLSDIWAGYRRLFRAGTEAKTLTGTFQARLLFFAVTFVPLYLLVYLVAMIAR